MFGVDDGILLGNDEGNYDGTGDGRLLGIDDGTCEGMCDGRQIIAGRWKRDKIGRAPKDHDGIASDGVIEVLLEVCVVFVGEGGEDVVDSIEGCGKQSIGEEVAVETRL